MDRVRVLVCKFNWCPPLFIQKVNGGGRPGGGLQSRTSGEPSVTTTGSSTSLGHRGASEGRRRVKKEERDEEKLYKTRVSDEAQSDGEVIPNC